MLLPVFLVLFACARAKDLLEPKFQVLTPDELMVEVPHYEDKKLVTFRIGVRRAGQDEDDLELGENDIDNNRVFIYDQRLKLKEGDVVNYLLAFRDKGGYRALSGNYYFNGVYFKKRFRRHRFRRDAQDATTTEKSQDNVDETEEFDPVAPRFGGGFGHHHGHNFPNHHHHHPHGFNPWGGGPRQPYPGFPQGGPPPFGPPPNSGNDCNDHRHDMCHGRDVERWRSSTAAPATLDVEYYCRICDNNRLLRRPDVTTRRTTTTDESSPEIDIRFSD